MKKIYSLLLPLCAIVVTGCSKDDPFPYDKAQGQLSKSALQIDKTGGDKIITTKANEISADDFTVIINREGDDAPAVTYKYSEMPEIISLPVGSYTVTAIYGEDVEAAFESPYYMGKSESFNIRAEKITDDVAPILCKLENVMVSVEFDRELIGAMSSDSYVEIKVGDNEGLIYTLDHHLNKTAGHFHHTEGISLVATFHGTVEGVPTVETKSYDSVAKGNHYKLKFRLHTHDSAQNSHIDGNVLVDASVTVTDINRDIDMPEDERPVDDMRPTEGDDNDPGNDPGKDPDDKNDCQFIDNSVVAMDSHEATDAPYIEGAFGFKLDTPTTVTPGMQCGVNVHSCAGITEFSVQIISEALNADELSGMGLNANMSLVNPGEYEEGLSNLGFPVNIAGEHNEKIDISAFMGLLQILAGDHKFILTVTDANGTTVKSIILHVDE